MKEIIQIVKNFTPAQRLNIILLSMLYCCYLLITTLQSDVKIARDRADEMFQSYKDCINDKK